MDDMEAFYATSNHAYVYFSAVGLEKMNDKHILKACEIALKD